MQRHFNAFIAVFVVHVVDDVQRVNVSFGEPVLHLVVQGHHFIIVENFFRVAGGGRGHLFALEFIHAAVQGVEKALGEVGARSEELHLLADAHGGHAACDAVVVAPVRAHQVVVLVLDGGRFNGNLGAEAFEGFRQVPGPQNGQVRFRSRPQVVQGLQHAEGTAGDEGAPVLSHAADGFRHPGGVSGEQVIVIRRADETDDAQLHHELVDDFLNFLFRDEPLFQVAGEINVEESGNAAQGHGRSVLFLHGGQVAQVRPLHGFAGVCGGASEVAAVGGAQLGEFFQGAFLRSLRRSAISLSVPYRATRR